MTHTDLVVLPLPHGRDPADPDIAFVSAVLLPRLRDGDTLADHADWRRWPDTLDLCSFSVVVNGFRALPGEYDVHVTARTDVWEAVFNRPFAITTPTFTFDPPLPPGVDPRSYPQGEVTNRLDRLYRDLASRGGDAPPTVGEVRARYGHDLGLRIDALREYLGGPAGGPVPETGRITFGEAVSLALRHPQVARLLGLVVELQVDLGSMVARGMPSSGGPAAPYGLQVGCDYATLGGGSRAATFPTVRTTPTWWPAPIPPLLGPSLVVDGQLGVSGEAFEWGPGHGLLSALELARRLQDVTDDAPLPNPLTLRPPLELRHRDRVVLERERLDRQAVIEASLRFTQLLPDDPEPPPTVELWAEDVAATYRADVRGGPHAEVRLRSLHERVAPKGHKVAPAAGLDLPHDPDEGWVGTVWVTEAGGDRPKLPQSLLRWDGWSLSAVRPAGHWDNDRREVVLPDDGTPDPSEPVQLGIAYEAVPGSLPRLLYGHRYELRVRAVDLAGNSIPNEEDGAITTAPVFHGRYTPVPAPVPVRRAPLEGDQVPGNAAASVVLTSRAGDDLDAVPPEDRLLFPASSSPLEWELMDRPAGLFTKEVHAVLADLEVRTLDDQLVEDPTTAERIAGEVAPDGTVGAGAVEQVAELLRDPAVRGLRFTGLPGQRRPVVLDHAPASDAPDELRLRSLRLVVHAGDDRPEVRDDATDPGLHVWAPPAYQGRIRVSSALDPELADRFALFDELRDTAPYVDGQHWLVSAQRRIEVVHAIPLPRQAPVLPPLRPRRRALATEATLLGPVGLDVAATGAVRLEGSWDEVVDEPGTDGPVRVRHTALLGTDPIAYDFAAERADVEVTYTFGTTARRAVTVRADAVARWTRHFIRPVPVSFASGDVQQIADGPVVPGTVSLRTADGTRSFAQGTAYTVDTDAGTITRAPGGGIFPRAALEVLRAEGTGRVPSADGPTPTVEVVVPASAPPPAPVVTEVVPVRRRAVAAKKRKRRARSRGRMLRVHLARPWFASGEGERLAVLVDAEPTGGVPVTTTVARDPRTEDPGAAGLDARGLTAGDVVVRDVTAVLADGRRVQVDAVGHTPSYDAELDEWVVDVEVDSDAHRPFVRLVVARLQPDAVPAYEDETGLVVDPRLSTAVELDPVRLGADRRVDAKLDRDGGARVTVLGDAHDGVVDAAGGLRTNDVVALVQEHDPAVADDQLGWRTVGDPVVLDDRRRGKRREWRGDVPATGSGRRRLVLEEHEAIVLDDGSAAGADDSRVVWVEVVPLTND